MATQVVSMHQAADQQQMWTQAWTSLPSWGAPPRSCSGSGNTWSKRLSAMADDGNDSWEERAFAEDTFRSGAQWPPRSYSCSFCKRGFRTAQALGGHMNVHRGERQRLANKLDKLRNAPSKLSDKLCNASEIDYRQASSPASHSCDLASLTKHLLQGSVDAEVLSPEALSLSLSGPTTSVEMMMNSVVPSPESISSGIPVVDILCGKSSRISDHAFHPYERLQGCKGDGQVINLRRFSIHSQSEDSCVLDLELRLGR